MASTVSKTRKILLDVARQLFARNGVTNTTMNDIAIASKKGRRTLYKYFRNKNDLFAAIVEEELIYLHNMLLDITEQDLPPDEKFQEFIITRFDAIREIVKRNGTLKAEFFRNIWKVDIMRRGFDKKEILLIIKILEDGNEKGIFKIDNVKLMAKLLHYTLKGYEVPYIRGVNGSSFKEMMERRDNVTALIFDGLRKRE